MKICSAQYANKTIVTKEISSRLGIVSAQAINTDSYIDLQIDIIKSIDWKNSKLVDKIKVIMHISESTIDYFDEFVSEPDDNKRIDALVDAALLAFHFAVKEYNINIPTYISMFEDKIVRFILTATYMFIKDRKWKKTAEATPVATAPAS